MKKTLLAALLGIVIAFAIMTSCSIHHRSGDYACTTNADCEGGRICDNGFCIVPGSIDAPGGPGDGPRGDTGNNCPSPCTTCNVQQKTCTVNCMQTSCSNTVTCPAGYRCDIMCNTEGSCRNGINCQMSTSCNVDCSGKSSCQNVQCGTGPCDVACSGTSSCRGVFCNASCACDVLCTGDQSCTEQIFCSSLACKSGSGCSSVSTLCHSCP